jgi:hypothetical protein
MNREESRRASALGRSLVNHRQHLAGRILDVFELNVLSPPHMQARVGAVALGDWIKFGGRGNLIVINKEVFVWTVADAIRQPIRARLWREGLFIDDSSPEIWSLNLSHIPPAP